MKTVGFAFIDLLALMALKASREAYASLQVRGERMGMKGGGIHKDDVTAKLWLV